MEYETARVHEASHWLNRPGDGMDEVNATATAQGPSAPIAAVATHLRILEAGLVGASREAHCGVVTLDVN